MLSLEEIYSKNNTYEKEDNLDFLIYALPLIHKLQDEGASFMIKVDGEREANIYTILIQTNNKFNDTYFRAETDDLVYGINKVIHEYSETFWH